MAYLQKSTLDTCRPAERDIPFLLHCSLLSSCKSEAGLQLTCRQGTQIMSTCVLITRQTSLTVSQSLANILARWNIWATLVNIRGCLRCARCIECYIYIRDGCNNGLSRIFRIQQSSPGGASKHLLQPDVRLRNAAFRPDSRRFRQGL